MAPMSFVRAQATEALSLEKALTIAATSRGVSSSVPRISQEPYVTALPWRSVKGT